MSFGEFISGMLGVVMIWRMGSQLGSVVIGSTPIDNFSHEFLGHVVGSEGVLQQPYHP